MPYGAHAHLGAIPESGVYEAPAYTAPRGSKDFLPETNRFPPSSSPPEAPGSPNSSHNGEPDAHGPYSKMAPPNLQNFKDFKSGCEQAMLPTLTRPESIASSLSSTGPSPDASLRQGHAFSDVTLRQGHAFSEEQLPKLHGLMSMPAPTVMPPVAPAIPPFVGPEAYMRHLPQAFPTTIPGPSAVSDMCSTNSLASLSDHPAVKEAARKLLSEYMGQEAAKQQHANKQCSQMATQMAIHMAVEQAVKRHASTLYRSHVQTLPNSGRMAGAQAMAHSTVMPPPPHMMFQPTADHAMANAAMRHLPTLNTLAAFNTTPPAHTAPALSAPHTQTCPPPLAPPLAADGNVSNPASAAMAIDSAHVKSTLAHTIDAAELDGLLAHPSGELNAFFDDFFMDDPVTGASEAGQGESV